MVLDVVIIGGSFAGLSAAMTLGRSLLRVACIDGGQPCNRFATSSHNSIAFDGDNPIEALEKAREKVKKYLTVKLYQDEVVGVQKEGGFFDISTKQSGTLQARKLIFAAGIKDKIEETGIGNLSKFWGKTAIHCPYCHGYEIRDRPVALYYQNPKFVSEMVKVVYNWNKDLVILTNGVTLDLENKVELEKLNIKVVTEPIDRLEGVGAQLEKVVFSNGSSIAVGGLYLMPPTNVNANGILTSLGVELENNFVKVDGMFKTNVPGVFASGDCTTPIRSVTTAMYQGMMAGTVCSKEVFTANWSQESRSE